MSILALSTIENILIKHGGKKLSTVEFYELTGFGFHNLSNDEQWAIYDAKPRHYDSTALDNECYELSFGGPGSPEYIDTYPYEERGEVRPDMPEAQFAIKSIGL